MKIYYWNLSIQKRGKKKQEKKKEKKKIVRLV